MTQISKSTTYSQKRAQQLLERSDKIAKIFNINNFYDNNHINVGKLKQKIQEAKKKLLDERQKEQEQQKYMKNKKEIRDAKSRDTEHGRKKNISVMSTGDEVKEFREFGVGNHRIKRAVTKAHDHHQSKISSSKIQKARIPRLATDLGEYQINRKNSYMHNNNDNRLSALNEPTVASRARQIQSRHIRMMTQESPANHSKSVMSIQIEHKKIVLGQIEHFKQFQMKIALLWELYEAIVNMMQSIAKYEELDQKIVLEYIKHVTSQKYQFVHEICDLFPETRVQRFIRLSRILQNFSVFEMCLNSIGRKKGNSTQVINYLGYSSSSVIFLIKILLLSHETAFTFAQNTQSIIDSIIKFQISSYKSQIRNIKQVLRRLQHNNQIIGMIKSRCGKKHGKYCQEFINKIIKSVDKIRTPFYQCANNIFQFLSFYLHFQNISGTLPLLATPPSPFLSLAYSKTIIIDPWCVLANRKNNKLVIRAHAGKFLAEVSDSCNLIFWTQFMPKDAEILTNLFPVKQNVYWLYRYHCRQQNQFMIKLIDLVGCITENTIIIDSIPEHYAYNPDIGISMFWRGQKKDTKLLNLSSIIQYIFEQANKNKTNLRQELQKIRHEIDGLNKKMLNSKSMKFRSRG